MSLAQPHTGHDRRRLATRLRNAFWRSGKALRQHLVPRKLAQHVFVAGVQRSGTNLIMDVLDATLDTQVFHETDARAFVSYEMRDLAAIRQLASACSASSFVIKALCELDRIRMLMDHFPPAKTLWMIRDWRDTTHSAVKSFANFVPQWKRLAQGDASDWRGRGMSDATRTLLSELYRPEASEAEGAAIMWYYRNVLFFEQNLGADPRVRCVFYEELVEHPEHVVGMTYKFLGLNAPGDSVVARIHARSARRRVPTDISPQVADLCDELLARFRVLEFKG